MLLMASVLHEFWTILRSWNWIDSSIALTAAMAAMACALPGNFLVVRRQSMMGDALSHTALPGIVIAFLIAQYVRGFGWIGDAAYDASKHMIMFGGALVLGLLTAVLTEWVQKLGKVEASAALGVVFTSLFALGVLLLRAKSDDVDLDPDCVLYGLIETVGFETYGGWLPRAAVANGVVFLLNGLLVLFFYKELRISAFDPPLATTLGINAQAMHYGLMAVTAGTVVSAFESVGSILVIAMLIAPPATAYLLTDRFARMILYSLIIAAASAVLGHVMALTVPSLVFSRLGFTTVTDASTAGMIAAASGLLFLLAVLFAPQHGILAKALHQWQLSLRIAGEDLLGILYRLEEDGAADADTVAQRLLTRSTGVRPLVGRLALLRLRLRRLVVYTRGHYELSTAGRQMAMQLVRSHRLWETYMARHFMLEDEQLHRAAERVEHFIGAKVRSALSDELDAPGQDPHGRKIPGGSD